MPADTKPTQGKGKQVNKKTLLILGGAALAIVLFMMLRKKTSEPAGTKATEPGTEGLSNQSFIPVTGENVAGIGAGGGGSVGESGSSSLTSFFSEQQQQTREYMQAQQTENREARQSEKEWLASVLANLGTGGGAPHSEAPPGSQTAPPEAHAEPPKGSTPTPKAPPAPSVPMNIVKCGNGCQGHEYPKGKNGKGPKLTECQVKNAKKQCVWP